jgi:hypothetical protein
MRVILLKDMPPARKTLTNSGKRNAFGRSYKSRAIEQDSNIFAVIEEQDGRHYLNLKYTLSTEQLDLRRKLPRAYPILGRAIALREALQGVLADGDLPSLRWWLGWADRSQLEALRKTEEGGNR